MSKLSIPDFIKEFDSGLSRAWKSADLSRKKEHSLYELYVLKLVLQSALNKGADISYRDGNGIRSVAPTFCTGPHQLYDRAYPYLELQFSPRLILEVHTGAKFIGKSGVEHECDIVVLNRSKARQCRASSKPPSYRNIILSVECKFYTGNINLGMSREFVGLTMDLTAPKKHNFYVVSTSIVDNGKRLFDRHNKKSQDELIPTNVSKRDELTKMFELVFASFVK